MTLAPRIQHKLDGLAIPFDVLAHPPCDSLEEAAAALKLPAHQVARAVVLREGEYLCMVVLPLNFLIDFADLKALTHRDLQPLGATDLSRLFPDCDAHTVPPLGELYQIETFYEVSLLNKPTVLIEAGRRHCLIRLTHDEFVRLVDASHCGSFAKPMAVLARSLEGPLPSLSSTVLLDVAASNRHFVPAETLIHQEIPIDTLALPALAARVLEMIEQPMAGAFEQIIESDSVLRAQLKICAADPLFSGMVEGQSPKDTQTDTQEQVIESEIFVMLGLGLSILNSLRFRAGGALGHTAMLKAALATAVLASLISRQLDPKRAVRPDWVFLAGLLHDLGFFVCGHYAPAKYFLLNRLVTVNPQESVPVLENMLNQRQAKHGALPVNHPQIGARVLESWQVPQPVCVAVLQHHDLNYTGLYSDYAHCVLLADFMLKGFDGTDTALSAWPLAIIDSLHLDRLHLEGLAESCPVHFQGLHALVTQLT